MSKNSKVPYKDRVDKSITVLPSKACSSSKVGKVYVVSVKTRDTSARDRRYDRAMRT